MTYFLSQTQRRNKRRRSKYRGNLLLSEQSHIHTRDTRHWHKHNDTLLDYDTETSYVIASLRYSVAATISSLICSASRHAMYRDSETTPRDKDVLRSTEIAFDTQSTVFGANDNSRSTATRLNDHCLTSRHVSTISCVYPSISFLWRVAYG